MNWDLEHSKLIYGIGRDDLHFLDIEEDGILSLNFNNLKIRMDEVLRNVSDKFEFVKGSPSFTLRMPYLIKTQINKILNTFDKAIQQSGYEGEFKPLYPIKVNQMKREVVAVMEGSSRYGLEAGTKSELFLILKMVGEDPLGKERMIMCNGVKDIEYIHIVKKAMADGYNIYISVESITEMKHVIKYLDHEKLKLFLRIKPYVSLKGYWGSSAGRNSKFGLTVADLEIIKQLLKDNDMTDSLVGVHAHPGSQVSNFYQLSKYFKFLIKSYIHLSRDGFHQLHYIDFGGGLPIDYDSRLTNNKIQRYADVMIQSIVSEVKNGDIKKPHLMIEAGRAVTALSSMLVIQPL